jgi:hypothetical protein
LLTEAAEQLAKGDRIDFTRWLLRSVLRLEQVVQVLFVGDNPRSRPEKAA